MARRILVVEDDRLMRDALVMFLTGEGYDVVTAGNGREALDRLRETDPCVILLDYAMPVMDGRAFREAQKADARWSAIPVILLTAHQLTAVAARSIDAVAILHKPVGYAELAAVVERACGREGRA